MIPADLPKFLSIVNGLAAIKPGKPLTPDALDIFFDSMADWTIEDFQAAANTLAKSCEYMPNPYHFEQLRKAALPTAGEAFASLLEHVKSGDARKALPHMLPVLNSVAAALGGWYTLSLMTTDEIKFVERRFCEHYEAAQDAQATREALPQLAGETWRAKRIGGPVSASNLLARIKP